MAVKQTKIILRLDPSYKKCPSCGEVNVLRRSRTKNIFESFLRFTGIYKMYRCRKCNWRGPLSTIVITMQSVKNAIGFAFFLLIIYFLIGIVIKEYK